MGVQKSRTTHAKAKRQKNFLLSKKYKRSLKKVNFIQHKLINSVYVKRF